jgi:pimeloyl-ACP methyl ester carboxylesterase
MYCIERYNDIYYIHCEASKEESPILFLAHGFPDDAFGMSSVIDLYKGKYHIIAPFSPGTLNERVIKAQDVKLDTLVKKTFGILNKHNPDGTKQIYLISHDLGCFLSSRLAEEIGPEHIQGMISINGLGLHQFSSRVTNITQYIKSFYVFLLLIPFFPLIVRDVAPKFFLNIIFKMSGVTKEINTNHLAPILIYRELFKKSLFLLFKKVNVIEIPTLFLWGNKDKFLNIPDLNEVEKFYKNPTVRILEGGHWIYRSNSKHCLRVISNTMELWLNSSIAKGHGHE